MITYKLTHVNGLHFELLDDEGKNREYDITVIDKKYNVGIYETKIKPKSWVKLNRKYISDLAIILTYQGRVVKQINLLDEIKGKRVFISFESKSLGDSIAWIPYCLEFQEVYNCEVIVSTFKNELFETVYPELQFVGRGSVVHNIIAMVELGWYWDASKEPINPITIPLQQAASNLLALPYREIQPRIAFKLNPKPFMGKYIAISTRSTAQCKHWYYWPELIQSLKDMGYRVIEMSQEADDYGAETLEDKSLNSVMNHLYYADGYIGLSSGISWLNWGMRKKGIMISNFTKADHEFQSNCIRITNENVCHGCWNNPMFKFNKGDWNWCPEHENSPRHFECHKAISLNDVLDKLQQLSI